MMHRRDQPPKSKLPILRMSDQKIIAFLVLVALVSMSAYWVLHGGFAGQRINIDRAAPLEPTFTVNINAAEWPELTLLPDIGEKRAKLIVDYREKHGPYASENDLLQVHGIGPKTLNGIAPYLLPLPGRENVAADSNKQPNAS